MVGDDRIVNTSVSLYKSDIDEITKRGLTVSGTLRELIHHIVEYDASDIFFSIRRGQICEHLTVIDKRIDDLCFQRGQIETKLHELRKRRDHILDRKKILESQINEAEIWEKICKIGSAIDEIVYQCDFDIDLIKEQNAPEIAEMEVINPGWNIEDHVKMRRELYKKWH